MTLPRRLLGQSPRLRLASALRLVSYSLPQRRLQRSLVARFHKIPDADTKTLREQPQRLHRGISHAPFQFGKESGCDDVAGSLDLGEPPDRPSPTYIGTYELSKSVEIHALSRTQNTLLMDTNKRMILLDWRGDQSDSSLNRRSTRRGMKSWFHLGTVIFVELLVSGCAGTQPRSLDQRDRLIRTESIEVPIEGIHVGVHQQGMKLYLTVMHLCDVKREDLLERITTTGSDVSREEIEEYRGVVRHAVPCNDRPAADVAIVGAVGEHTVVLGKSDSHGRLTVNLEQALSDDITWPKLATMAIQADGKNYGTADLSALYAQRESKGYEDSNHETCAVPKSSGSCNRLQLFLSNYPDGPHSSDAAATLRASRPIIEQFMDDEAWARTIAPNCTKGTAEDPAEIHAACEPYRYYLARYPSGKHAKEAHESLEVGGTRENKLLAEVRRREAAAAQREVAEQRKQCIAECRLGCSSWRFRDHAACFSGCVESRCSGEDQ